MPNGEWRDVSVSCKARQALKNEKIFISIHIEINYDAIHVSQAPCGLWPVACGLWQRVV